MRTSLLRFIGTVAGLWMLSVVLAQSQAPFPPRHVGGLAQDFARPSTVAQLLLNVNTALSRGDLLQPAFYTSEVLQKAFNGSDLTWGEPTLEQGAGVSAREGHLRVDADGLPKMSVSILERSRPRTVDPTRPEVPPVQPVFASITLHVESGSRLCVCDLHDELGAQTRLETGPLSAQTATAPPGATVRVVYEYPNPVRGNNAEAAARGSAVFTVQTQASTDKGSRVSVPLHGRDLITEFTITAGE